MPEGDRDLVAALRALGDGLDASGSPEADPATAAVRRIAAETSRSAPTSEVPRVAGPPGGARSGARPGGPRRRHAVLAAAALVVTAVVVVAVPGSRAAVARLFGLGGVRIVTTDEPPAGVAGPYDLGEPMDVEEAIEAAPGPIVPDGLGRPAAAFAGAPTGAVTVVWPASGELPPIVPGETDGAGLLVTALPGTVGNSLVTKEIGPGTRVEPVTVAGHRGYWISGAPHVVGVTEPSGAGGPEDVRLAGNTLLWIDGDVTYRLESALGQDGAVAWAERIGAGAPAG